MIVLRHRFRGRHAAFNLFCCATFMQLGCAAGVGSASSTVPSAAAPRAPTRVTSGALWHMEAAASEIGGAEAMVTTFERQTLDAARLALKKTSVKGSRGPVEARTTSWLELRDAAARASSSVMSQALAQGFSQMLRTASRARVRGTDASAWRPEDRAVVRRDLVLQARLDTVAASSTALLAAYQAVIERGADPKGIDAVAEGVVQGLTTKPEVSDGDVVRYVAELSSTLRVFRPRYEASLRQLFGNAEYASTWKPRQDALFEYVDEAGTALPTPTAPLGESETASERRSDRESGGDLLGTGRALASQLGLGSVATALRGAVALQKGDARGAVDAAIELQPVGAIKEIWRSASSLLFGG